MYRLLQKSTVQLRKQWHGANDVFSSSSSLDSMCLINECTSLYNCYGGRLFSLLILAANCLPRSPHTVITNDWVRVPCELACHTRSIGRSVGLSVDRSQHASSERLKHRRAHGTRHNICEQHLTNTLTLNRLRTSSDENGYCQAPAASTWAQLGRH